MSPLYQDPRGWGSPETRRSCSPTGNGTVTPDAIMEHHGPKGCGYRLVGKGLPGWRLWGLKTPSMIGGTCRLVGPLTVLFAVLGAPAGSAQTLSVDWKLYGSMTANEARDFCFYEAKGVVQSPADAFARYGAQTVRSQLSSALASAPSPRLKRTWPSAEEAQRWIEENADTVTH